MWFVEFVATPHYDVCEEQLFNGCVGLTPAQINEQSREEAPMLRRAAGREGRSAAKQYWLELPYFPQTLCASISSTSNTVCSKLWYVVS